MSGRAPSPEAGARRAILLAAYGAATPFSRAAFAQFEARCRTRFPAWPIRWAFTSPTLRERLATQKQKSDSVAKALARLRFENFHSVAIQPLQTIPGREYGEVHAAARAANGLLCAVGRPLLDAAPEVVARGLLAHIPAERLPCENVIFMGHGARHAADSMYRELADVLCGMDDRVYIGTMGGALALENLLPRLPDGPVWLLPLLAGIGQHALRDMAGPAPTSWKSRIEGTGRSCRPALKSVAQSPELAAIWLNHLEDAIARLDGG